MAATANAGMATRMSPTHSGTSSTMTNPIGTPIALIAAALVALPMLQPGRSRSVSYHSSTRTSSNTASTAAATQCHHIMLTKGRGRIVVGRVPSGLALPARFDPPPSALINLRRACEFGYFRHTSHIAAELISGGDVDKRGPVGPAPGTPPYSEPMSDSASDPAGPGRRQFEYLTAPLIVHSTKAILDNFGEDGWELVQVVPGPGPEQLVAYFKREKL